jgi:epoxyqueuosine reductase
MAYMAKRAAERADTRVLVPGAKSVIVVAVACNAEDVPGRPIARYARGRDYHNPMRRRLRKLARVVKRVEPDTRTYLAVDTGPVLERYWAERAGIGWIGKSSNLVTLTHYFASDRPRSQRILGASKMARPTERRSQPAFGSWVLLGTLIIDRVCDYDEPAQDRCGSCDACIPACPTGAILAPRVVDARLCISYLTIEARGGIPRDLRVAVGDHLFGCDDCQEACPWNRFAVHAPNAMLAGRSTEAALDAARFLEMDEAAFVRDFEGTALRRAGLTGMKRNALVVLGNSGNRSAVPLIERVLGCEPSAMLREHAEWALERLRSR